MEPERAQALWWMQERVKVAAWAKMAGMAPRPVGCAFMMSVRTVMERCAAAPMRVAGQCLSPACTVKPSESLRTHNLLCQLICHWAESLKPKHLHKYLYVRPVFCLNLRQGQEL